MRTRPTKFNDANELQKKIDKFFADCKKEGIIPTVTGLAVALDTSRKVILDYENYCEHDDKLKSLDDSVKRDISNTIKRAKARIESEYEQQLLSAKNPAGAIFTLKNNYGWVDKQEVVNTNNNIEVTIED